MKNYVRSLVVFVLVSVGFFFLSDIKTKKTDLSTPLIVTSNYALYDITSHLTGDKIKVVNLLPQGVDPHSFEPTPQTMAQLEKSALFIYSSKELEPWSEHLSQNIQRFAVAPLLQLRELKQEKHHEAHQHHDSIHDPHYWLDPNNMIILTHAIAKELQQRYPQQKEQIKTNAKHYISQLQQLDSLYKKQLKTCKKHTIVVTHNAFGYMAQRYHFNVESLTGLSSEAQPSPKAVTHILQTVQNKGLGVVFGESFANQKTIQSIANDLHISLQTLQPLGNITAKEQKNNADYVSLMKQNLQKISKVMECQ